LARVVSGGVVRGEEIVVEGLVLRPFGAMLLGFSEVLFGVTALALSARLSISVPGYPVPFTLQTMVLGIIVAVLGPRSWRIVTSYIAAGLLGLPVFAYGGGVWYVASPTFGYLLGFLIASIIVGRVARPISTKRSFLAMMLLLPLIYLPGVLWLATWFSVFEGVPMASALPMAVTRGMLIFIPWDLAKAVTAAVLSRLLARLIYRI